MAPTSQSEIRMLLFPGKLRDSAATWIGKPFILFFFDFKIPGRNHLKDSESWICNIDKFVQKYYLMQSKKK